MQHIEDLEVSVSESAVLLLYYSVGYFRSKNCRRELYSAVKHGKPIILLYEGGTECLQELQNECRLHCTEKPGSEYILEYLFMNDPIRWLDEGSFSAASLNLIFVRLLHNLPYYQCDEREELLERGLWIPGEIPEISLMSHLKIIVSEANEGALTLAQEVQHVLPPNSGEIEIISIDDVSEVHLFDGGNSIYLPQKAQNASRSNSEDIEIRSISAVPNKDHILNQTNSVFLLYLNKHTFLDDGNMLKRTVKLAKDLKIDVVMAHEKDASNSGCDFCLFFKQTPQELIESPYDLYNELAIPLYNTVDHRLVGLRKIIQRMGR